MKLVSSTGKTECWMSQWTRPIVQIVYSVLYCRLWSVKLFSVKHMLSAVLWELLLKAMIWDTWSIIFYHIFILGNLFNWWCSMYAPQIILRANIIQFWQLCASSPSLLKYLYYYSLFSSPGRCRKEESYGENYQVNEMDNVIGTFSSVVFLRHLTKVHFIFTSLCYNF